jgi:hypothetical protein
MLSPHIPSTPVGLKGIPSAFEDHSVLLTKVSGYGRGKHPGKEVSLNCLFVNVRGINAPGRKCFILDTIAKTHATIVGFQETKNEDFSGSYLKSISNNKNFKGHHSPAKDTAGGIIVGEDLYLFDID